MIGRREEVSLVRRLLQTSTRLVTLTGTAGVGKSRLAAAVAESLLRSVSGVWYVDLRGRGGEVASAIAHELKVDPGEDAVGAVIAAIGDTDTLLLLDDADGAVEEASAVVDALLVACSGVRIIVTSREPLASSGQALVAVGPFLHRDLTATSDAVRLFAERAATGDARFTVDDTTLPQVVAICEATHGVPLAIELAAAQLQFMDAQTLARRMGDQLHALEPTGSESRSLRAAVEDSWRRCSPLERRVWSDLSVLAPGWDLELGEAMAGRAAGDAHAATTAVKQLVRRSVVHRRRAEGGVRYELLPAIREFGAEKLEHRREAEGHFLLCMLARLHDAEDDWFSDRQAEILRRLRGDIPNIRRAVKTAASHGEADRAVELTVTAWRQAWQIHGSADELGSWLTIALRSGTLSPYWAALGHGLRSVVYSQSGKPNLAEREQEEAVSALAELREEESGRPELVREADAAVRSATEAVERDDGAAVLALRGLMQDLGEDAYRFGRTNIPQRLAARLLARGERAAGYAAGDGVLERGQVAGDRFERSFVLTTRAAAAAATGDYETTAENARAALLLKRGLGNLLGVAQALELLADVAREQADPARGATLLGTAAGRWEEAGAIQANYPPYFYDRETTERALRHRMGDPAFEKAFAYGRELGEDESIDFALRGVVEARTRSIVPASPLGPALTPRERQVAALVADGESNKAIARRLFVSIRTVEAHVQNALVKLGLRSRTELALWYREHAGERAGAHTVAS